MAGKRPLSPKDREFALEYVWGEFAGNGAACAVKVGLCKERNSARRYAHTLLRKPQLRELVEGESAEKERQLKQKWLRVVEESFHIATVDPGDAFDEANRLLPIGPGELDPKTKEPRRMPEHVRRAIASIEVETRYEGRGEEAEEYLVTKIKLHPKHPSVEFIAKISGKLKDTVKIESDLTFEDLVPKRKPPKEE